MARRSTSDIYDAIIDGWSLTPVRSSNLGRTLRRVILVFLALVILSTVVGVLLSLTFINSSFTAFVRYLSTSNYLIILTTFATFSLVLFSFYYYYRIEMRREDQIQK